MLKINNLKLYFGEKSLSIENLNAKDGVAIVINGPNGSGKSTFFNLLASIKDNYYRSEGDIILGNQTDGEFLLSKNNEEIRHRVIIAPQQDLFFSNHTVLKAALMPSYLELQKTLEKRRISNSLFEVNYMIAEKFAIELIEKWLIKVNISDYSSKLSGGQKKLLNLISLVVKARVFKPYLILFDEPLNHLDFDNKRKASNIINDFLNNPENKSNIIIISHCNVFPFINDNQTLQFEVVDGHLKNLMSAKKMYKCLGDYFTENYNYE
jgi:ABC-type multidrug transport system ATPase subunit